MRVGESALLSCRAIAGIPTPTIIWVRRDQSPLSHRFEEKYPGTIVISNITLGEGGEYECKASNAAGEVTQTTSINVQEPPVARILPDVPDLTITEGDELKLECFAEGTPAPSVQWKEPEPRTRNGAPGIAGYPLFVETSLAPQSIIHKYNVDRSAEGTYICHASNGAGEDQKYITVIVEPKRGDVGKLNI